MADLITWKRAVCKCMRNMCRDVQLLFCVSSLGFLFILLCIYLFIFTEMCEGAGDWQTEQVVFEKYNICVCSNDVACLPSKQVDQTLGYHTYHTHTHTRTHACAHAHTQTLLMHFDDLWFSLAFFSDPHPPSQSSWLWILFDLLLFKLYWYFICKYI